MNPEDATSAAGSSGVQSRAQRALKRRRNETTPERVGPFRILGELGRGGMGSVLLGTRQDDKFGKRVAIKLLRRGVDTDEMLQRFDLERQVLGALNHPNIARLYEAGATEEGRPYFVMELVEGRAVDRYCDEQNLSVAGRLELFRKVCSAVHYAHQNLVVHRDIKPSNIMVTVEGEPKLLDFGIAKIINPELMGLPALTRPTQRLMTYEYASPEQVRGEAIGTASDIYGLGVLLYELLTGRRPYEIDRKMHEEAVRVICETEPDRPSTAISKLASGSPTPKGKSAAEVAAKRETGAVKLKRRLTGDLDNIVLMAMRKSPHRRYSSAEQFAEDLRRHLHGETVVATAPTLGYRAGKFVRRHRVAVTSAAAVTLALVAGVSVATWQWGRAESARRAEAAARGEAEDALATSERRYDQLRRLTTILEGVEDEIARLQGATRVRELLSEATVRTLDQIVAEGVSDPTLAVDLASGYRRAAEVAVGTRSLADEARAAATRGLAALDAAPDGVERALERARLLVLRSQAAAFAGELVEADRDAREALEIVNTSDSPEWRAVAARALERLAISAEQRDEFDVAWESLERAGVIREELAAGDDPAAAVALAQWHQNVGLWHRQQEQYRDAVSAYGRGVALVAAVLAVHPDDRAARSELVELRLQIVAAERALARGLADTDRLPAWERASDTVALAIEDLETMKRADPYDAAARFDLVAAYEQAAKLADDRKDPERAIELGTLLTAEAVVQSQLDPLDAYKRFTAATVLFQQGKRLREAGRASEALAPMSEAVRLTEILIEIAPDSAEYRGLLLQAATTHGVVLEDEGELDRALAAFRTAAAAGDAMREDGQASRVNNLWLAASLRGAASTLVERGRGAEALAYLDRAASISPTESPLVRSHRAESLFLTSRPTEALELAQTTLEEVEAKSSPSSADRDAMSRLQLRLPVYQSAAAR